VKFSPIARHVAENLAAHAALRGEKPHQRFRALNELSRAPSSVAFVRRSDTPCIAEDLKRVIRRYLLGSVKGPPTSSEILAAKRDRIA
jgi:hypothetical protein